MRERRTTMKYLKSILMVCAVVLAGLTLTMLAPKAAHAIAATAVQLMNTTATPVPVDEDNSARHAFTLQCQGNLEFCWTNQAPATGVVVLDFVYISAGNSAVSYTVAGLKTTLGGQNQYVMIPLTPTAKSTSATAVMPIKLYIDNNSNITVDCFTPDFCRFTAVGHTVTP
jgi:hypothetical protein